MSEINWYYVDRHGQRHGPVSTRHLGDAARSGNLRADNLIWHAGLDAWQPLQLHAASLGLHMPPEPPPVPGPPPPRDDSTSGSWRADGDSGSIVEPQEIVYAGFWRRFAAIFLDQLVLGAVWWALWLIIAILFSLAVLGGDDLTGTESQRWTVFYVAFCLAWFAVAWAYYAFQHSSRYQATLGKRVLGIKVTDAEGKRLTLGRASGRWCAAALSYLTLYIGFLMAAFTDRKRALHDMAADTLVVDRWAFTEYPERQQREASGCLIAVLIAALLVPALLGILAAIAVPAYQDYVVRANISSAIASAHPVEIAVADSFAQTGACPSNGEGSIAQPGSYASQYVSRIDTGTMQGTGWCGIQLTTRGIPNDSADGKLIWLELEPESGTWLCSSEIADKYLPANCRG